jgi:protein-S-isoprenylcysteine O-methyltransferase Ste14
VLLTDGWWRYSRKPHYAGDLSMTLSWGLITGFSSILPWIYVMFFFGMLFHRRIRDETRCTHKYKKDWETYTSLVPWAIFPYIY